MWTFIHTLFLALGAVVYLPLHSVKRWRQGRSSAALSERLGWVSLPQDVNQGSVVWVHAVSLGETKALFPVIQKLRTEKPELEFVFSFATSTAKEEAKRLYPFAKGYYYFPLDFPWIWRRFFNHLRPRLVILSETDFWYEFLHSAKKVGAITVLVNGKISNNSLKMFQRVRPYADAIFSHIDHFYLQNDIYLNRFAELGISKERMHVTGNLKIDSLVSTEAPSPLDSLNQIKKDGDQIVVVASTHPGEEKLILDSLKPLLETHPQLKIWFAPRHPERFLNVFKDLQKEGLETLLYSKVDKGHQGQDYRLLLLDKMGLLKSCFSECHLAIVGGSFVPVGGHNILEVTHAERPVLFGPYMHTQQEFVDLALRFKVGEQVEINRLQKAVEKSLHSVDPAFHEACRSLFKESQGAAELTYSGIESCLKS